MIALKQNHVAKWQRDGALLHAELEPREPSVTEPRPLTNTHPSYIDACTGKYFGGHEVKHLPLVLLSILFATTSWGATLYIDKSSLGGACSDSLPGTSPTTPWCTLSKANTAAKAGDTVMVRQGTYSETIAPAQSGINTQSITYQRYANELVTLLVSGSKTAISLVNKAYITIDGINIRSSGCTGVCYARLDNSNNIWIKNGTFEHPTSDQGGGWPLGISIANNSHHNRLSNNTISRVGYSTTKPDDIGGLMIVGNVDNANDQSFFNLIEGNKLYYGGHHIIELAGSYNVIRGNYLHNEEWMNCSQPGGKCGNRLIVVDQFPGTVNRNVIENNTFAFSGLPPDDEGSMAVSLRTPYNIVRRNVFHNNDQAGLNVATQSYYPHDVRFNHIYNNVFFHNGYPALGNTYKPFESGIALTKFGSTGITDVIIKNNIFWQNRWQQSITYYNANPTDQIVSNNWLESGDPLFINDKAMPDPFHPEALDFHLQAQSPVIDKGTFLTKTTVAGTGKIIQIEDSGYFTNGSGIVEGDLVQLQGQKQRARVVAVDYAQHTLTLDTNITWQQGQGVSLAYEGLGPDLGAYELQPSNPNNLKPPANLRIVP
jgi:hypothetical protein